MRHTINRNQSAIREGNQSAIRVQSAPLREGVTWKTDLGGLPTVIAPLPTSAQPSPSASQRSAGRELAAAAR